MRNDAAAFRVADQVSDVDRVIPASEDDSGYDAAGGDLVNHVATVLVGEEFNVVGGDAVDHSPTPERWVKVRYAPG